MVVKIGEYIGVKAILKVSVKKIDLDMKLKLGNISEVEVPHMTRGHHLKPQNFGGKGGHTMEEKYHSAHQNFLLSLSAFFILLCSSWI